LQHTHYGTARLRAEQWGVLRRARPAIPGGVELAQLVEVTRLR
jgi:hypothetical protein